MSSIQVQVRYFASLRERLGAQELAEVPAGTTVAVLRRELAARDGDHAAALSADRPVRCALNQVLCDPDRVLSDGDELAFFPPVTGG